MVKHGLSLADAPMEFNAPDKLTLESPKAAEARLMDVAMVEVAGVVLAPVWLLREPGEERSLSLPLASQQERTLYANYQETD